jgi:hypothetical protein
MRKGAIFIHSPSGGWKIRRLKLEQGSNEKQKQRDGVEIKNENDANAISASR